MDGESLPTNWKFVQTKNRERRNNTSGTETTQNIMLKQSIHSDPKPTQEEIATAAYAIFEKSGRIPGRDVQNWLEAEAQLQSARKNNHSSQPVPSNGNSRGAGRAVARAIS